MLQLGNKLRGRGLSFETAQSSRSSDAELTLGNRRYG